MSGGIFLLDPAGELTEMAETAFAAEVDLQKLLADHPGLLPGDQIDPGAPRRWLLVCREAGIPDQDQGGARWALDHLFLDQDGVPTLVEVKRGTDPRTRREVVGQMLDYAANCVLYWTAESIQTWLARRCQEEGNLDPDEQIAHLLGEPAATGDFWQRVKTNLKAGKIRLLFVSDAIPELRRIVEFLNEQMDPAEVLAVEIRQYTGKDFRTLVPRVLGQTTEALVKKTEKRWAEPTFFAELTKRTGEEKPRWQGASWTGPRIGAAGSGGAGEPRMAPSSPWCIMGSRTFGPPLCGPMAGNEIPGVSIFHRWNREEAVCECGRSPQPDKI